MMQQAPDGTAYEVIGDSGPQVVLIHGLGMNRASWQWQAGSLGKHYQMITYDLYGHGDSYQTTNALGTLIVLTALAWGAYILLQQYQKQQQSV